MKNTNYQNVNATYIKHDIINSEIMSAEESEFYYKKLLENEKDSPLYIEAVDRIVNANLKLVAKWCSEMVSKKPSRDWEETYAVGLLGFTLAVRSFNYTKGAFSNYCFQYMCRYLTRNERISMNIVIPDHKYSDTFALKAIIDEYGDTLTIEELTEKFNIRYHKNINASDINTLRTLVRSLNVTSFDTPIDNDKGDSRNTLLDTLPDKNVSAHEEAVTNDFNACVRKAVSCLPELERRVVSFYYGLGVSEPLSYTEIADHLNITPSRASSICKKGITTIRKSKYFDELKKYAA